MGISGRKAFQAKEAESAEALRWECATGYDKHLRGQWGWSGMNKEDGGRSRSCYGLEVHFKDLHPALKSPLTPPQFQNPLFSICQCRKSLAISQRR